MISESIGRSIAAIQRKRKAQESRLSFEAQASALAQLDTVCAQAKSLLDCCAAIRQSGIAGKDLLTESTRKDLSDSISSCGNAVADHALGKDVVSVFSSALRAAAGEVNQVWKTKATSYAEGARGYLSLIAALTTDPQGARMLASRISDSCSVIPTTRTVQTLIADVSKANAIISHFPIKPEIEAFLKKVSAQQATVFDLTPEVMAWLTEQRLTGKLKVNF